jgi:tetratricopeptide (TPR) repeat protein
VRFSVPLALLAALPALAQPKPDNQLDGNESLFTVLAAVNAAGYDADIDSLSNSPVRKMVREYLATQKLDCLYDLQRFVKEHKQRDSSAELSQYVSFALSTSGPPLFTPRYANNLMPPDVAQFEGFAPLLAAFYREAKIPALWKRVQPDIDKVIEQYHEPASRAVLMVNAYTRNATSGYLGRRFQIYFDLLGAPNQVQTRSYADDYFVVITPSAEPRIQDIRHGYLHYLIDPLGLKYDLQIMDKAALGDIALNSPLLAEHFRKDFILLTTECFIKAIESRIDKNPEEAMQAAREGFIMAPALAEILAEKYETQDAVLNLVFPDLLQWLNLRKEKKRFEGFQFATEASGRTIHVTHVTGEKPVELKGAERTLDQAETSYTKRDLATAKGLYLNVLTETPVKTLHAKAYYGLARIDVLEKNPETAYDLFHKVLELEPDPYTKSWTLLYLARLAASQADLQQEALDYFKAALAVEGVPDSVRQAAEKGLKDLSKNQ